MLETLLEKIKFQISGETQTHCSCFEACGLMSHAACWDSYIESQLPRDCRRPRACPCTEPTFVMPEGGVCWGWRSRALLFPRTVPAPCPEECLWCEEQRGARMCPRGRCDPCCASGAKTLNCNGKIQALPGGCCSGLRSGYTLDGSLGNKKAPKFFLHCLPVCGERADCLFGAPGDKLKRMEALRSKD